MPTLFQLAHHDCQVFGREQVMFTGRIVLAALVLGCAAAAADGGQSSAVGTRWERQVRSLLTRAVDVFGENGYELTHQTYTGSLTDGGAESLTLWLDPYREYRLVGVCDDDCDDLDFELFDDRARIVDEDVSADALAMVVVQTRDRARYRLKISMASCSTSPCWYGVGVFSRVR
jgi:hypothetical protein